MNKILKIIVSLVQIGGGLLGLGLIVLSFLDGQPTQTVMKFHIIFGCVFLFGVVSGLALIIKPRLGLVLSALFQAVQIPFFIKSGIAYAMSCGACVNLYKHASGWGFNFFFGSRYSLSLNSEQPWLIGVNIVALVLFVFLIKEICFFKSFEKPQESRSGRLYSARRSSQDQSHLDNSSPLRHIIH